MVGMLGTENMIVEVRNPLLPGSGGVKVSHRCADMLGHAVPEESWILIREVSGRQISKLPVHSNFLELAKQGVRLSRIERIAQLTNEVGGLNQPGL